MNSIILFKNKCTILVSFQVLTSIFCLCAMACKPATTANNPEINDAKLSSKDLSLISTLTSTEKESATLKTLVEKFNAKICKDLKETRSLAECYELHALAMQGDFLQSRPYTLSFPYDDSFDLSMIDSIEKISWITNACGLQNTDDSTIHFSCLKSRGAYMDVLKRIQSESPLIIAFYETYQSQQSITPNLRQSVLLESNDKLDFSKSTHRMFYMLFHIMVNEERLAYKQLAPNQNSEKVNPKEQKNEITNDYLK